MTSTSDDTASSAVSCTVKRTHAQRRPREYLTEREIERLMTAARKHGRYGHRDATMILIAFRHGFALRLCDMSWSQIEIDRGLIHVQRRKHGVRHRRVHGLADHSDSRIRSAASVAGSPGRTKC
jgi:integrase